MILDRFKTRISSKKVHLHKNENDLSEIGFNDFKITIDLTIFYFLELIIEVTKVTSDDTRRITQFELSFDEILKINKNSEVTYDDPNLGLQFVIGFNQIYSSLVYFGPREVEDHNSVAVLSPTYMFEFDSKSGYVNFHLNKGEKYVILLFESENESYLNNNLYLQLKDISPIYFYTSDGNSFLPTDDPGEISIVPWNSTSMAIIFEREKVENADYKIRYVIGNDIDRDLKDFEVIDDDDDDKKKSIRNIS